MRMRRNHVTTLRHARGPRMEYGRIAYYAVTVRGPPARLSCIRQLERHFEWPIMLQSRFLERTSRIPHGPNPHGLNRSLCYVLVLVYIVQKPKIADSRAPSLSIESMGRFLTVMLLKSIRSLLWCFQTPDADYRAM